VSKYIWPTIEIRQSEGTDTLCCVQCGYALTPAGQSWKRSSVVIEIPTDVLIGEPNIGVPAETVVRQFVCRGCGVLLDTETAIPGEPWLEDVIFG